MPTYEYRCKSCSRELEIVQSFTDDALTTCEACGGQLRKLFGNVGIAFKGTGFYKNDSREKVKSAAKNGDKTTGDKAGSDKSSNDKTATDKSSADKSSVDKSGSSKDAGSSGGGKSDAATTSPKTSPTSTATKGS